MLLGWLTRIIMIYMALKTSSGYPSNHCLPFDANMFRGGYKGSKKTYNPYEGVNPEEIDLATFEPIKYYKLPADPWHIICRWTKEGMVFDAIPL
jgi:hypothetical protein